MIEFIIKAEIKKISFRWINNDPLYKVYLFMKPLTPAKCIQDGELKIIDSSQLPITPVEIYKSNHWTDKALPSLPNATYHFSLFADVNLKEAVSGEKTAYIGTTLEVYTENIPFLHGFEKFTVTCKNKIDAKFFWLAFSDIELQSRFHLPPMKKTGELYQTSCLLAKGAYERLQLCVDPSIEDCIRIVK